MQVIEITGVTGTGPYSIYLCDLSLTYCYLMTGSTSIPPTYTFELPSSLPNLNPPPSTISFAGAESVIIKLVDLSNGCENFSIFNCPASPTPTPTMTPTPTPTPTSTCRCITVSASTISNGDFYYTDCLGVTTSVLTIPQNTILYYCGSNPVAVSGCTVSLGGTCVMNSCP